jgi:cold shock CspA family protein
MEKLTGTVKWFDSKKGYGFITADTARTFLSTTQASTEKDLKPLKREKGSLSA